MPRTVTVLVVEDDAASRANTQLLLDLEGFVTRGAADGAEGLEAIRNARPDVVVCDIMMPGMDGLELLAAVRQDPDLAATPFIFLTGLVDHRSRRAGMNGGADDYLTKPISPEDLFAAIAARLARLRHLRANDDDSAIRRKQVAEVLSPRELEVFELIGAGVSSKNIAARLSISPRTVDSHRAKVIAKLDLAGAAALIGLAARLGPVGKDGAAGER